jgi:uncharacterized protein (DUF697 family)
MAGTAFGRAWDVAKGLWNTDAPPADLEAALGTLRAKQPAPVFWLLGKTQSGKTSIIRYLTGAEDAAIGNGFRPTTRTTREYPFPTPEAPLLSFLDTRGLDEPGYDPAADVAACDPKAHLVIVTAKIRDFAQGAVKATLEQARSANRSRPVLLALTCLHEAYPQQQHRQPYPLNPSGEIVRIDGFPDPVPRLITEQCERFAGLFDAVVPIDFTRPDEGYDDPNYGGDAFKNTLLQMLPGAYRQTLLRLDEAMGALKDAHLKAAIPVIIAYASMAASAGAIPVPFVDLFLLPGIQSRMVYHLAKLYGQPLDAKRFLELAASLGLGLLARQAIREVVKFIPFVGSYAGAGLAWGSTYALGRAFCLYYQEVHEGHVPDPSRLKRFYQEQLTEAEKRWKKP